MMDRETSIKLAHETLDRMAPDDYCRQPYWTATDDELEHFAKLVAEHEREAVIAILKGIDETEIESPDGWWETSTGAEFGAAILASIRARGNT